MKPNTKKKHKIAHVVVYFALLTGPLRIQLWSQDRGSDTKTNRERTRSEKNKTNKPTEKKERRQKEADVKLACKEHRRQEGIAEGENKKQKTNKSEINKGQPHIIRVGQEKTSSSAGYVRKATI